MPSTYFLAVVCTVFLLGGCDDGNQLETDARPAAANYGSTTTYGSEPFQGIGNDGRLFSTAEGSSGQNWSGGVTSSWAAAGVPGAVLIR
jgi:hypothetical protein